MDTQPTVGKSILTFSISSCFFLLFIGFLLLLTGFVFATSSGDSDSSLKQLSVVGVAMVGAALFVGWQLRAFSPEKQIAKLTNHLELYPADVAALEKRANLYWQQSFGNQDTHWYTLAIGDAQQIIVIDPTHKAAYELQIECYISMRNFVAATEANERFLAMSGIDEDSLENYYAWLFEIHSEQEALEKFIPVLEAGLQQYPQYEKVVLHWLAYTYDDLEQDAKMVAAYERYQAAGGVLSEYDTQRMKEAQTSS